jgi:hypothetical protein
LKGKWSVSLAPKDPNHPELVIIIKKWRPFEYVVTLKAYLGNETVDIRRWDNIDKEDHMDVFYSNGKSKKHIRPPLGKINNLEDLKELCIYIDRNHKKYIEKFKREIKNGKT